MTNSDLELALMHLKNNQNASAYNMFVDAAKSQKKDPVRAALALVLAAECKNRQNKDYSGELAEAAKIYFSYAKSKKDYTAKSAFLCAAKCFLKAGRYDDAKEAFEMSKKVKLELVQTTRPVVIVDDSKAIVLKIQNYLKKLGFTNTMPFYTGNDALAKSRKILKLNPIILLDMGLPDVNGDIVASKILELKPDAQIILITADEKSTKRVKDTISSGAIAFIQKPFTIKELKDALDTAESEYRTLEQK